MASGGQTGVDRGALDAAIEAGVPCGGWCPRGRRAEDGTVPARYTLRETEGEDYETRTRRNVAEADATLVLTWGPPEGGTALTVADAEALGRPCLVVDLAANSETGAAAAAAHWLAALDGATLNVAGPRESRQPGAHAAAHRVVAALLAAQRGANGPESRSARDGSRR